MNEIQEQFAAVADRLDELQGQLSEACLVITLRDHFAAAALQGMLAHSRGNPPHGYRPIEPSMFWMDGITIEAYALADAMLRARGGGE